MKKHYLMIAAAAASMAGGTAMADASDWYLSAGGSYINSDERRSNDNDLSGYFGLGRYIGEKFGIELDYNDYSFDLGSGAGDVDIDGFMLTGRYYFIGNDTMSPFLGLGVGRLDHDTAFTSNDEFAMDLGFGVEAPFARRWAGRAEIVYRLDSDNTSINSNEDDFDDWMLNFGLTYAFGDRSGMTETVAAAAPVAPATDTDSDNDGVMDRNDRCPNTPAGVQVDAYGCPLDSDNDGVADYKDDCPNTPAGNIVDDKGCNKVMLVELTGVHFDFDKATLTTEAKSILDSGVAKLKEFDHINISIAGHTDSIGSDSYNKGLSDRRAKAVHDYMMSQGIAAMRMQWAGYGENSPVASNDTEEGRARNRRVELKILNNK